MAIFTVIVNYNAGKEVLECLRTLKKSNTQIVVVDNASSDGSVATIEKTFPQVEVIKNSKNLGFAAAANQGIKHSLRKKAAAVVLLNPDTLAKSDFVDRLWQRAQTRSSIGIVGPKIYFAPGFEFHSQRYKKADRGKVIWYAGGQIDWDNIMGVHRGVDEVDSGQFDQPQPVEFVSGCCMLVKAQVFKKIGLLDERYFMYLEDMDFCHRARRAGFQLFYEPQAVVWHKNALSSGGSGSNLQTYFFTRNRLLFGFSYAPWHTRFALFRQSLRYLFGGNRWQRRGVVDFYLRRFYQGSFPLQT